MNKIYRGYYEEKKSRFYCFLCHISCPEEIKLLKEHALKAAKDICHVVTVSYYKTATDNLVTSLSNSNEPIKVAEKIYLALQKNEVKNIAVAISRHFGGIPLGAGNLNRAYYQAFSHALAELKTIEDR